MLTELNIQNYRSIQKLSLDSLKRVNLFTGKNNTGKTTLLEAIYILMSTSPQSAIYSILFDRQEILKTESSPLEWSRIFHNQNNKLYDSSVIIESNNASIKLTFVPYEEIRETTVDGAFTIKRLLISPDLLPLNEYSIGIHMMNDKTNLIIPTNRRRIFYEQSSKLNDTHEFNCKLIRTSADTSANSSLWDNISLDAEKENIVISALQLIEPTIEKLAFKGDDSRIRRAFVKLSTQTEAIPIGSLGDGVNRILTVILALVNSENGILLIDEFENGLHYSVQSKLWEIIFKISGSLNVQIFATTHSNDCIKSFNETLYINNNMQDGQYFNLIHSSNTLIANKISTETLTLAIEENIETR